VKNRVRTGADQLHQIGNKLLKGKRFALLTNPTGIDARFKSTIDICANLNDGKLVAFFACEHGLRNERQAGVLFETEMDPYYGIPVYSLYSESSKKPTAEMLKDIDTVVFDIQDLGVRFYTYLTTLIYVMEACAANNVEVIVLDRPNPLGGYGIEGGYLQDGFQSMVGGWKMPASSGMTIGEFAKLVNGQMEAKCELRVVPLEGWDRSMEYVDTGLPWIVPSPNMPTMDTVRIYVGNCLFEGTNLSEGRGTTRPFEQVGAPWLRSKDVCEALNGKGLTGVWFHPVTFSPAFSKHQGSLCNGIMTYVTDKSTFCTSEAGLHLLHTIQSMHEDQFQWLPQTTEFHKSFIDVLTGSELIRTTLHEAGGLDRIIASWRKDCSDWKEVRKPYLLYEEKEGSLT